MQKLLIENIKYEKSDIKVNMSVIIKSIKTALTKNDIFCKNINLSGNSIIFENGEKLFESTTENIINLKVGDSRLKKLRGRNFLKSKRLTGEQHKALHKLLAAPFDDLGIVCTISFKDGKTTEVWRSGTKNSFPKIDVNKCPIKAK